jgi:hypothetical protein
VFSVLVRLLSILIIISTLRVWPCLYGLVGWHRLSEFCIYINRVLMRMDFPLYIFHRLVLLSTYNAVVHISLSATSFVCPPKINITTCYHTTRTFSHSTSTSVYPQARWIIDKEPSSKYVSLIIVLQTSTSAPTCSGAYWQIQPNHSDLPFQTMTSYIHL